jgi:hypothetical protein
MNFVLQKKKTFLIITVVFLGFIFTYSRILQAHADESGRVFDDRCNNVNPSLIAYKNSYLQMWNIINNSNKYPEDALANILNEYVSGIKKYLPLENEWIKKDSDFINRWDFQLFEPDYMKNVANLQLKMYEAQRDNAEGIVRVAEDPNSKERFDPTLTDKFKKASQDYFTAFDEAKKRSDWRKYLWKAPPINCPEENLHIPETDINTIFATPAPIPNLNTSG